MLKRAAIKRAEFCFLQEVYFALPKENG